MRLDGLHILNLCVFKDYCRHVVWDALLADVWATQLGTQYEIIVLGLQRMVRDLKAWHRQERAADCLDTLYDIGDITVPMIGKPGKRTLALKAAECGTFLVFCRDVCRRFPNQLPNGSALAEVGGNLARMRFLMRTSPPFFSDTDQQ